MIKLVESYWMTKGVNLMKRMGNKVKEDERIEGIIRGLLKLPENRRCINCNSLVYPFSLLELFICLIILCYFLQL